LKVDGIGVSVDFSVDQDINVEPDSASDGFGDVIYIVFSSKMSGAGSSEKCVRGD